MESTTEELTIPAGPGDGKAWAERTNRFLKIRPRIRTGQNSGYVKDLAKLAGLPCVKSSFQKVLSDQETANA